MTAPQVAATTVLEGTPEFPVTWVDPSDPGLPWQRDDMHMPFALAPLAGDYIHSLSSGFAYGYERTGLEIQDHCRIWNGYVYFASSPVVTDEVEAANHAQYVRSSQEHARKTKAYWRDRARPELAEIYRWVDAQAGSDTPLAEMADTWDAVWKRIERAWSIHFYTILGPYQVLDDLADFFESKVEGLGAADALRLVQGSIDELQDVDRGIERLAALAAAEPALADRLGAEPVPSRAELVALSGGAAFVAELDTFLDAHGHLGQGFDDLSLASWAEDPAILLAEIGKRLRYPVAASDERRARLAAEAEAVGTRVRQQLAERPEDLSRFDDLHALARDIAPLTEGHNYWIDRKAQATLRRYVIRVGGRLVEAGALAEPSDVIYLYRAEVPELLRSPADRRAVTAERRAEHARQRLVTPPTKLGTHREKPEKPVDRFSGARFDATQDGLLRGTGASAGIVRGTARVVLGPADFGRVQAGDIIVAPSSNPSWIPLFTMAAGLVTNRGGVLSHAAVVAREFGLPAVVGLRDATTLIADGRTVELDGTQGTVRLL